MRKGTIPNNSASDENQKGRGKKQRNGTNVLCLCSTAPEQEGGKGNKRGQARKPGTAKTKGCVLRVED